MNTLILTCPACLWQGMDSKTWPTEGGGAYGRCPQCGVMCRWPHEITDAEQADYTRRRALTSLKESFDYFNLPVVLKMEADKGKFTIVLNTQEATKLGDILNNARVAAAAATLAVKWLLGRK